MNCVDIANVEHLPTTNSSLEGGCISHPTHFIKIITTIIVSVCIISLSHGCMRETQPNKWATQSFRRIYTVPYTHTHMQFVRRRERVKLLHRQFFRNFYLKLLIFFFPTLHLYPLFGASDSHTIFFCHQTKYLDYLLVAWLDVYRSLSFSEFHCRHQHNQYHKDVFIDAWHKHS